MIVNGADNPNLSFKYCPSSSTTSKRVSKKKRSVTFGSNQRANGNVYEDTVFIDSDIVEQQPMLVDEETDLFDFKFQALIGFRYSYGKDIDNKKDNSLIQTLAQNGQLHKNVFSFLYSSGLLTIGDVHSDYENKMNYVPLMNDG